MSGHGVGHTPGPWRVKAEGSNVILSNDQDDDLVATTRLYSEKGAANARLIADAPAMAEALASIRVFAQDCIENGHDRGQLGNLYAIRDLCDRLASRGGPQL